MHSRLFFSFLLLTGCMCAAHAAGTFIPGVSNAIPDSLVPVYMSTGKKLAFIIDDSISPVQQYSFNPVEYKTGVEEEPLLNTGSKASLAGRDRRALSRLLRVMKVKKKLADHNVDQQLFSDLASVSIRLKLYPLAMQCYYQSVNKENDTDLAPDPGAAIENVLANGDMDSKESEPVAVSNILQSFNDDKTPLACALIVHVKQPVPGKRRAFRRLNNVGHMFITLIKYNTDKTAVSRSFGFYPRKSGLFDATPIHPSAAPVFRDDSAHDWDESIGKFISYRRLIKVLKLLGRYEQRGYHLNENNCTDFGLQVASLSGIDIMDTKGKWPLGKGNSPAFAGQSIVEHKYSNTDSADKNDGLFISVNKNNIAK